MNYKNVTEHERQLAAATARFFAGEMDACVKKGSVSDLLRQATSCTTRLQHLCEEHMGAWPVELLVRRASQNAAIELGEQFKMLTWKIMMNGIEPATKLRELAALIERGEYNSEETE